MAHLSEPKRRALVTVLEAAPERVLSALSVEMTYVGGAAAALTLGIVQDVLAERRAIAAVFSPITPNTSGQTLRALWRALAERRPAPVRQVLDLAHAGGIRDLAPKLADGLCADAASVARGMEPAALRLKDDDQAERLASFLDLAPIARSLGENIGDWIGRLDRERLAALRLAFKDADDVREDGRPLVMEMLAARLPGPGMILRLVSAVTDNANERFVQGTELARIGEALVQRVEILADGLNLTGRAFASADVAPAVAALQEASDILSEFEIAFPSHHEGGSWTTRLTAARRKMTEQLETVLRDTPRAVDRALPLGSAQLAGRMSRMIPNLSADPASDAVHRARALLSLLAGAKSAAMAMGCESLRKQAADMTAERTDQYAEQILQSLHDGDAEDEQRALALLEVAADFLSLSRGAEAGALVRRRAAVATEARDHQAAY